MTTVFLVPAGAGRHELYSEPHEAAATPDESRGYFAQQMQAAQARWQEAVERAHGPADRGAFARLRDAAVRQVAESVAEQRALWALRTSVEATLVYPESLGETEGRAALSMLLSDARRYHRRWLAFDSAAFLVSGVFALVPGPNLVAYYFAVRLIGHYFAWRGSRQAADFARWQFTPSAPLAELVPLASADRDLRRPAVVAVAEQMNLPRLAAFFDRIAVPGR